MLVSSCGSDVETPAVPLFCDDAGAEADSALEQQLARGFCHLQRGETAHALKRFEAGIAAAPKDARANFMAGFADLLLVLDQLYTGLYDASLRPKDSFSKYQASLVRTILGGSVNGNPKSAQRLERAAKRFELASQDASFRMNVDGYVVRLRELPLYVDHYEFDVADGHFLSGLSRLLQGFGLLLAGVNLDVPTELILNEGEPIYTILKLDLNTAFSDYPSFFSPRLVHDESVAEVWLSASKSSLLAAMASLRKAIVAAMSETDNQSVPDDPQDRPDYLSQPFLTLVGNIYIPGIFGPSPTTAITTFLAQGGPAEFAALLGGIIPDTPDTFPEAWDHLIATLEKSLGGEAVQILDQQVTLSAFFDSPASLKVFALIINEALGAGGEGGGGNPWLGGGNPKNRVDPDKLAWEHPELYEPIPTPEELEADPNRGVDGPAAELHIGNGYLLAGISREGRLKNLYFPGTTSYNLVPYLTRVTHPNLETEPIPYMGANPEHGSFAGLRLDGKLQWLMDRLDHRHVNPNTTAGRNVIPRYPKPGLPVVEVSYTDPDGKLDVQELSFVPDDETRSAVVRHFIVTNKSAAALTPDFVYYGAFNVTDIDQYILGPKFSATWQLSENRVAPAGEAVTWTGPGWARHPDGAFAAIQLSGIGPASPTLGVGRLDVDDGTRGAYDQALTDTPAQNAIESTRFGNAYLSFPLGSLESGASAEVSIIIATGAGKTATEAANVAAQRASSIASSGVDKIRSDTETSWQAWQDSCTTPAGMSERELEVYRLAAMALKLSQCKLTGALPEMLDMQPMWYMVWPGSGVWQASAMDVLGHHDEADRYFDYVSSIQAPEGHWRMAYTTLGDYHGAFELEYYMTPSLVWFTWMHWQLTGDDKWLAKRWPMAKQAADFVLARRSQNGLLYASPDYVEDATAFRQSLYTNSIAVAGLIAAAEMATALDEDASLYEDGARKLYHTLLDTFWDASEERFWHFHDMHGMHGHGADPVMAFPYHVFELDDPRMDALATGFLDERVAKQDFVSFKDSADWTPGLMMWTVFYVHHFLATKRQLSFDNARFLLDGMLEHRTLAGFIPERYFGYGVTGSGKPLLWPHAAYIIAQNALHNGKSPLPLLPSAKARFGDD